MSQWRVRLCTRYILLPATKQKTEEDVSQEKGTGGQCELAVGHILSVCRNEHRIWLTSHSLGCTYVCFCWSVSVVIPFLRGLRDSTKHGSQSWTQLSPTTTSSTARQKESDDIEHHDESVLSIHLYEESKLNANAKVLCLYPVKILLN